MPPKNTKSEVTKLIYPEGVRGPHAKKLEQILENSEKKLLDTIDWNDYQTVLVGVAMLADGVLPSEANKALGAKLVEVLKELTETKSKLDCLNFPEVKRGPKEDEHRKFDIFFSIEKMVLEGATKAQAYKQIAEVDNRSADTIRRMYERYKKDFFKPKE